MTGVKLATAYYELIPSMKGSEGVISKEMGGIGASSSKAFGGTFSRGLKATVGPAIALLGAASVGAFLKDSVGEAREAQKVGALTNNVIKQTGGVANISAKQVGRLSTEISNKTGIDDEAVQSGANLLLTFKNVRNEAGKGAKVFDRATQAAADLSAAGFGDLNGASKQLGKALNDPIKGISALSRAGVTFTEQQKKQIKTLVGQNDLLGAQKIILKEVESQVGGAAAASSTLGEKASVAFGNFKESIGTALLPVIDDLERTLVTKGVPAGERFAKFFKDEAVPAMRDFGNTAGPLAKSTLPAIGSALGTTRDVLKDVVPLIKGAVDAFNSLPKSVQSAVVIGAGATALGTKVSGSLPAFTAKGKAAAGGKAGKGKGGGLSSLPIIGAGVVASLGPLNQALDTVANNGPKMDLLVASFDNLGRSTQVTKILLNDALVKSNFGARAAGLGLDVDKVSDSLASAGTSGVAYRDALKSIDDQVVIAVRTGNLGRLFELGDAKKDLEEVGTAYDKASEKAIPASKRTRDLTLALLGGGDASGDLGRSLDELDKKNSKPKVSTPGLYNALTSVGNLGAALGTLSKVHATPSIELVGAGRVGSQIGSILGSLNTASSKAASLKVGANARGTDNWRGGLSVVGEEGPELLNLPRGSQVIPAGATRRALSARPGGAFASSDGADSLAARALASLERKMSRGFQIVGPVGNQRLVIAGG